MIGKYVNLTDPGVADDAPENARKSTTASTAPFASAVKYGAHERNLLDFYRAKSDKPTPVVIFFHGGGFVQGSRSAMGEPTKAGFLKTCLYAGVSVVSADYRLIQDGPFPAAMLDGARAIQFVRSKAEEWNIDPDKVALSGGSAGGNMSIWLAVKGELAKPDSADPIERLSTKVSGALVNNAQTSNDPQFIKQYVYNGDKLHPSTLGFFGITSFQELSHPDIRKKAYEASAINFVSKATPPIYLDYNRDLAPGLLPEDTPMGDVIHSPKFGEVFKQKMDEAGAGCVFHYKSKPAQPGENIAFLKSIFQL